MKWCKEYIFEEYWISYWNKLKCNVRKNKERVKTSYQSSIISIYIKLTTETGGGAFLLGVDTNKEGQTLKIIQFHNNDICKYFCTPSLFVESTDIG